MALNQLNLIFGPALPPELEKIGLSFLTAPFLAPDSSVASLSAHRYVPENYTHLASVNIFDKTKYSITTSIVGKTIDLAANIPNLIGSLIDSSSGLDWTGSNQLDGATYTFDATEQIQLKILHDAIKVIGLQVSLADSWYPIIKPGVVWRKYVISSLESPSGWLKKSGLVDGDEVFLIYTVPEARYYTRENSTSTLFPGSGAYQRFKEIVQIIDGKQLKYTGLVQVIKGIKVNGKMIHPGELNYDGSTLGNPYVLELDKTNKLITLAQKLLPDDEVELEYLAPQQNYIYSGYYSASGNYWSTFDVNPESGHFINDEFKSQTVPSSQALLTQVTIYAAPTAYLKVNFTPTVSGGNSLGQLTLNFQRAINYGETHFIRHLVSNERLDELGTRITGTAPAATWGHAICGLNFYNEYNFAATDFFSRIVPNMLPLAKICLTAPAAIRTVANADVRIRGGGIPEDVTVDAIDAAGGLDRVRGYWDMATWSGAAIKEGGLVEIKIDESILKADPNDPDPNKFLLEEIEEIVTQSILPGVDYKIIFTQVP